MTATMDGQLALLARTVPAIPEPDPEDPTWWKQYGACVGVDVTVFYPADVKRTGPETVKFKAECLALVRRGMDPDDVAIRMGCSPREVREWLTKASSIESTRRRNPARAGSGPRDASGRRASSERPGVEAAKAICRTCPVVGPCLEFAITEPIETDGVWGCMDPEERRLYVRRRRAGAA